jgi:hypothetical protein
MLEPLHAVDIDAFLTPETAQWCTNQLALFDGVEDDEEAPFLQTYLWLRERVREHRERRHQPTLTVIPPPTGGVSQYVSYIQKNRGTRTYINYFQLSLLEQNAFPRTTSCLHGDRLSDTFQQHLNQFQEEDIQVT